MDGVIICSCILLRDFNSILTDENRIFCKHILLEQINSTSGTSSSIEYYISVLPLLLNIFPDEKNEIKLRLLELLLGLLRLLRLLSIIHFL